MDLVLLVGSVLSQAVYSSIAIINDSWMMGADKVQLHMSFIKLFSIRY